MPKLPSFFETSVTDETKESTKDHQGRLRTVPHKVDSWATYVYFKVDLPIEKIAILKHAQKLEPIEEQHISLTRPTYFKRHQLEDFISCIKNAMKDARAFNISFAQMALLTNDENTRSFLTLEIGSGYNELSSCLTSVDQVMTRYKKEKFYDPPRFHTSLAWSLTKSTVESCMKDIPETCIEDIIKNTYRISKIYVKTGHIIQSFPLN